MKAAVQPELTAIYDRRFAHATEYRRRVWSVLTRHYLQRFVPIDGDVIW